MLNVIYVVHGCVRIISLHVVWAEETHVKWEENDNFSVFCFVLSLRNLPIAYTAQRIRVASNLIKFALNIVQFMMGAVNYGKVESIIFANACPIV